MGEKFDSCVRSGGRVRTIKPNAGTFIHVCFKNGKSFSGRVRHVKRKR